MAQQHEIERGFEVIDSLSRAGLRPACDVSTAAEVVTDFYKGGVAPFGEVNGFPERKALARHVHAEIVRSVALLSPTAEHFRKAVELWYAYCNRDAKEAYAGFSDYVTAALVLQPPIGQEIAGVLIHHPHLHFILRKSGSKAQAHYL